MKRLMLSLALIGLLAVLLPAPLWALTTAEGTGMVVAGEERLSTSNARTLRALITQIPPTFYPHLQVVTVDSTPPPPHIAATPCVLAGTPGPCWINIWSTDGGATENPFPSDAPVAVISSGFYVVAAHEIGHNVSYYARRARDGGWWEDRLVAGAGCEPTHYLRSMFAPCFFRDSPQEFTASMMNQWITCSTCTIRLALARWDRGIYQPMDQIVYLLWLFGSQPANGPYWPPVGQTLAFEYTANGPQVTMLSARPWACNGTVEIVGPAWVLALALDDACHVTGVLSREGLG